MNFLEAESSLQITVELDIEIFLTVLLHNTDVS